MKEKHALTKRCCGPEGCGTVVNPRMCIGSDCMAWEPDYEYKDASVDIYGVAPEDINNLIPEGWYETRRDSFTLWIRTWVPLPQGDCGLKSKPCENNCRL